MPPVSLSANQLLSLADTQIRLGIWDAGIDIPKELSLENSEENLEGRKKKLFLQFMRKMVCWVPEERKTARELLEDPWLNGIIT